MDKNCFILVTDGLFIYKNEDKKSNLNIKDNSFCYTTTIENLFNNRKMMEFLKLCYLPYGTFSLKNFCDYLSSFHPENEWLIPDVNIGIWSRYESVRIGIVNNG